MSERRRYFRIDDTVGLNYKVIDATEARHLEQALKTGQRRSSDMVQLFHGLEVQVGLAVEELRSTAPQSAAVAELLNEKINILGRLMIDARLKKQGGPRGVNLSACGLAFDQDEAIDSGTLLELQLTLFPSYTFIVLIGEVVDCPENEDGSFNVRLDYRYIRDEEQEALIHHMVQRQNQQLRDSRES